MSDPNAEQTALRELAEDTASRKRFFKMAGAGAAGSFALLLAACGGDDNKSSGTAGNDTSTTGDATPTATADAQAEAGGGGDLEIVNYALTLEYLEADFYDQVINSGLVKDKKLVELAKSIGEHENEHVEALKATAEKLGGPAAEKPKTAFEEVLGGGLKKVLNTAATVENLGAAAYFGQAGKIKDKEILAAALAIHSVEARHAAALNHLVGRGFGGKNPLEGSIPDGAFAKAMSMDEVLAAAKPFIAS
jgi:rubrerythrin